MELLLTIALSVVLGLGLLRLIGRTMGAAGDPNIIGQFVFSVPCDAAMETTPTIVELGLLACPDDFGMQLVLEYVGFRCNTKPADASNDVHVDIEFIDDSASDAVTTLKEDYDLEDDTTNLINNTVWQGYQVLDPGDVINAEFTITTPDTASEGACFILSGKVLAKNAG